MKQKKFKIFVAVDTKSIKKAKDIIRFTKTNKLIVGYKFGLEFLNSKNARRFIGNLKNKITFGDYKLADIPNTCVSTIKAVKDLKLNYITIHISSGLKALKAAKKASGSTKLVGVSILTSLDNKSLKEIGFIRLTGDKKEDQKRVTTPRQAYNNGATSIVIGRSLTRGNIKKNVQKLINQLK